MLNLDVLGAIAFDKGCYTGQEVIARAHYRGRVKRRMQRFVTRAACALDCRGQRAPSPTAVPSGWWRPCRTADGRCEFLAVAPLVPRRQRPRSTPTLPPPGTLALEAQVLPLPYVLPQ